MFYNITVIVIAIVLGFNAHSSENPKIVNVAAQKSYIPTGFDDNDRVQVTIVGIFPNTCYKIAAVDTRVDEREHTIHIWQTAYLYSGICTRVFVPFTQVVNVGIISNGIYNVYDGPSKRWLAMLTITRSTHPGPDDYLYASISDGFLTNHPSEKKTLTLLGTFPDRCTQFKEVQVHYYSEVIVVQPIVEQTEGSCMPDLTNFRKVIGLDPTVNGVYLLHIRSMNGQAINKIVDTNYEE